MNLNDLANLGQIIGALAVVISLFYVASQIRQNTNAVLQIRRVLLNSGLISRTTRY